MQTMQPKLGRFVRFERMLYIASRSLIMSEHKVNVKISYVKISM